MRQTKRMRETDETIIEQVLNGNRNAYALLVDQYKDRVFSLIIGIVRNREAAEELAQDVFVKAYSSLKKFRREAGFSTWIYRIAYNTAISETRKKKYIVKSFDEQLEKAASIQLTASEDEQIEENESKHKLLEQALSTLPPEDKLILMLYYFEEKSVEEISKATRLTTSNVKVKLFRLRNKLKELMMKISNAELAVY